MLSGIYWILKSVFLCQDVRWKGVKITAKVCKKPKLNRKNKNGISVTHLLVHQKKVKIIQNNNHNKVIIAS